MDVDLQLALSGAIWLGMLVIAAFFLRSWCRTRDRLFLLFAAAFVTLAIERAVLIWLHALNEAHPAIYLLRLLAFSFIAAAVIAKNRGR